MLLTATTFTSRLQRSMTLRVFQRSMKDFVKDVEHVLPDVLREHFNKRIVQKGRFWI